MLNRLRIGRSEALHLGLLVVVVLPLFIWTGHWGKDGNPDTLAVAIPAWEHSLSGSLDLSHLDSIADNQQELARWYVTGNDGNLVSNRAPGLIWMAIPSYGAFGDDEFSNGPATIVALTATFLAVVLLWFSFRQLVPLSFATLSSLTLAFGTMTWFISSSELWPHGPGQLWAALAVTALGFESYVGVGLAFGLSITTRPVTGIYAATIGVVESWRQRRWGPALKIALASLLGLAALVAYNGTVLGEWTIRGGYAETFTRGALERFSIDEYLANLWNMFFGLPNGVLVTTPIVGVSVYGAIRYRSHLKPWMLSLAIASTAYLVIHAVLNRASGGTPIFYRYPLESLALASPVLVLGAHHLYQSNRVGAILVGASAAISVALQVLNVVYFACFYTDPVVPSCLF